MALTKVAPAGIGSTPGDGYRIGSSFLHSTGVELTNANASGIVTAAQFDGKLNIGIATFTDDVKFTGATSGRDVLWDKSENSLEFGDYTYAKFGADTDLTIWSNDTLSAINNKTGELRILSADDVKILKRNNDGTGHLGQLANFNIGGAVELFYNATKRIETSGIGVTVTGQLDVGNVNSTGVITATKFVGDIAVGSSITYADNEKAYFGTDLDLEIYHSGSHSFIKDAGTGMLKICADMLDIRNAADNATLAYAQEGNKFELFYNGSAKLATTNTGAVVTGILTATNRVHATSVRIANDNFTAAGNADELVIGTTSGNRGLTIVSGNTNIGALFFADDGSTNIGSLVYEHNLNQMRMNVAGAQIMRLDYTNSIPTWIIGTDLNTHISLPSSDTFAFTTGGDERLRIDSSGNIGINDSSPDYKLDVNGTGRFTDNLTINTTKKIQTNSSTGQLTVQGGATYPGSAIKFAGGQSGATDRGQMLFYAGEATSLEERLRIDSSGRLQMGSDPSNLGAAKFNIVTGGDDGISLGRLQGATVSSGDVLGTLAFQSAVGAQTTNSAEASIKAIAAENSSGSTAATNLSFYTKPTGTGPGSAPTERFKIWSTGTVGSFGALFLNYISSKNITGFAGGSSVQNYIVICAANQINMRLSGTFHLTRATGTSGVAISRIQVLAMTRNANNSDSALGIAYNIESDTSESAYPGIVGKYCTLTYSGTSYFAIKLVATTGGDLWGSNAQHCNFVGVGNNVDFFALNSSSHTITSVSELTGREGTKTFFNSRIGISQSNPLHKLHVYDGSTTNAAVLFDSSINSSSLSGNTANNGYGHALCLENSQGTVGNIVSLGLQVRTGGSWSNAAITAKANDTSGNAQIGFWTESGNSIGERLRIEPDGRVTTPVSNARGGIGLVGAFMARPTSTYSTNSGLLKITLGTEEFDANGWFNTSNSRYTPLCKGWYQFNFYIQYRTNITGSSVELFCYPYKNGASTNGGPVHGWNTNYGNYAFITFSTMIYCDGVDDYIEFYANCSRNTEVSVNSRMSGFLVHPVA